MDFKDVNWNYEILLKISSIAKTIINPMVKHERNTRNNT